VGPLLPGRRRDGEPAEPGFIREIWQQLLCNFTLFLDDAFDPNNAAAFDAVPVPGLTVVQALYSDPWSAYLAPDLISTLPFSPIGTGATPNLLADLATAVNGLVNGKTISLVRYRDADFHTARANNAWNNDPGVPQAVVLEPQANFTVPIWKRIDFVYGTNGTTYGDFLTFVQNNIGQLAHDPTNNDLDFTPMVTFQQAGLQFFVIRRKNVFYDQWLEDGMNFDILTDASGSSAPIGWGPMQLQDQRNTAANPDRDLGRSGISIKTRTLCLFYGDDMYNNAGFYGPGTASQPGTTARGNPNPGRLFCYDLVTNAAHELGHMQYLRHHWTGDPQNVAAQEHDHNDICIMSYFTSFVDLGGPQYSASVNDLLAGTNRDKGRSEPCGRCHLKLRGWHMGRDGTHLPGNHGSGATPPAANASNVADW